MLRFFLITTGFLIALGFTPFPFFPDYLGHSAGWLYWPISAVSVTALLPLLLAIIWIALPKPLNKIVAVWLAIIATITGIGLTLLYAGQSGVGMLLAMVHGLSLTLAITASILMLAAQYRSKPFKTAPAILLLVPLAVAMWSLVSGAAVVWQTNHLADGRPFCLASHDRGSPVRSFAQLRGLSFYTTASGYKSTSRWYFHGLLILKTKTGEELYNWSPRRMKLQRIEHPERFIASPSKACLPHANFWETVSIL